MERLFVLTVHSDKKKHWIAPAFIIKARLSACKQTFDIRQTLYSKTFNTYSCQYAIIIKSIYL